ICYWDGVVRAQSSLASITFPSRLRTRTQVFAWDTARRWHLVCAAARVSFSTNDAEWFPARSRRLDLDSGDKLGRHGTDTFRAAAKECCFGRVRYQFEHKGGSESLNEDAPNQL